MQRPTTYGQSPPLHHPVPQHVSTVPQLRSPPPPVSQTGSQQGYNGSPYQQQGGSSGNVFGAYGQFMNDPTAQVAAQFGQSAFKHGQEYMEQNVSCWHPTTGEAEGKLGSLGGLENRLGALRCVASRRIAALWTKCFELAVEGPLSPHVSSLTAPKDPNPQMRFPGAPESED